MKCADIEGLMELAISKALQGIDRGQAPFGAVIARPDDDGGYDVISCEHNEVWANTDITEHAEVNAIRQACSKLGCIKLTDCIIVSTTEPCPMCFSAIHWAGIKKIYFGASIADAQKAKFNELTISNEMMKELGGSPVDIEGGLLAGKNRELFIKWEKKGRGKTY